MQCFSSVWNGFMNVDCGRCYACLQRKRSEWTFRLLEEQKDSLFGNFVTLTYNDKAIKYGDTATLYKKDVQDYIKRVRKKNKYKIKYYMVGEYGTKTNRPHYHGIIFNGEEKLLREKWEQNGHVHIGKVNQSSIHYVTKYMVNRTKPQDGREKEFSLMSNGIGLGYIKRNKKYHVDNDILHLTFKGGLKNKLFRYYKQKIWTNELQIKRLATINSDNIERYYSNLAKEEQENVNFFKELTNKRNNRTKKMLQTSKSQ